MKYGVTNDYTNIETVTNIPLLNRNSQVYCDLATELMEITTGVLDRFIADEKILDHWAEQRVVIEKGVPALYTKHDHSPAVIQ
jgi:hypothetical protein